MAMNQESIALRAAEPIFDEGLVFARYLDEVAEGFFRFMLGRRVAEIIATAYTKPGHDLSYQHIIFAVRGKAIIGLASGYTARQHRDSSDQPLKEAAGSSAVRMAVVATLCRPVLRFLGTHGDGDFYVQVLAVEKDFRGQGIGLALIEAMEDRARAADCTQLALDVSAKNTGARRFYERHGMIITSAWPKRFPIPRLRILRMTKPL